MSISERKQAVEAAIGSMKIEGLKPSARTQDRLDRYASGKITATQMRHEAVSQVRRSLAGK